MNIVWGHYSVDSQGRLGGNRPDRACMRDIYHARKNMAVRLPDCYIYDILYYDADDVLQRKYSIRRTSCFSVLLLAGERVRIYAASTDPIDLGILQAVEFQNYKSAPDFLSEKVLSSVRHIKLIGDSITAGSGGSGYGATGVELVSAPPVLARTENLYGVCWANFLKYRLERELGCEVKNWGTAKYASNQLALALPQLIQEEDELVLCTIGTNDRLIKDDTLQAFSDRLRSILAYCAARNKRVIMMSPIPSSLEAEQAHLSYTLSEVRDTISTVCRQAGFPFLDLYARFQEELAQCGLPLKDVLCDGLHPNDTGYYLMYRAVCSLLGLPVVQKDARTLVWEEATGGQWRSLPLEVQAGDGLYLPPQQSWCLEYQDRSGTLISNGPLAQNQVRKVVLYNGTIVLSTPQAPEARAFLPYAEKELLPLCGNNMPACDYYPYLGQKLFAPSELKKDWPFSALLLPSLCNEAGAAVSTQAFTRQVLEGQIVLPTWQVLPVNETMWTYTFDGVVRSSKLWQYSLFWIIVILGEYEENPSQEILSSVERQLTWFFDWLDWDYEKLGFSSVPSADHSCAVRCVAMSDVLRVFPEDWPLRRQVLALLARDCEWMSDPSLNIRNNHGLIMLEGLLHVANLLRDRPREEACYRNTLLSHIESEMMAIYDANFDGEGLCRENTIGYHNFNLLCFDELITVCQSNAIPIDLAPLQERLERSRQVIRQLIWQDSCVPPIGDGHAIPLPYTSINKDHYYREGNWLIRKDEQRYFSFKCGFSSPAHKHVDEGSLTLRYCGRDILVDCGSYNYDRQSPIRQYVESARGHSGLYPKSLYPVLSPEYVKSVHQDSAIDYYDPSGAAAVAHGYYALKSGFRAERRVEERMGELLIEDTFRCGCAEDVELRFCLHSDTKVERICSDWKYIFRNRDIFFSIEILDTSSNVKLSIQSGHYSPELQQDFAAPVCVAAFPQAFQGEIKVKIQYGKSLLELLRIPAVARTLQGNQLTAEVSPLNETGASYFFYLYQDGHCVQTLPGAAEPKHTFELSEDGVYSVGIAIHRPDGQCSRQLMTQSDVYRMVSKPSINIYGSCVSRDIFALAKDDKFELKSYIARQSVISAVAPKIPCVEIPLHNSSSFKMRVVEYDLHKSAFEVLKANKSDYLLLDMIDERFPLLPLFGSYATASNEFYESAPEKYCSAEKLEKHLKDGKLYLGEQCVEDAVKEFCSRLTEIYYPEQIIIHYATMLDQYRSKSGRVKTFPFYQLNANHRLNAVIEAIYSRIQSYLPGVYVIRESDGMVADENHKWGLAPMHYEQEYYVRVLNKIYQYTGLSSSQTSMDIGS